MMIETERRLPHPFAPGDVDAYAVIRAKPSVARFPPPRAAGAKQVAAKAQTVGAREAWTGGRFAPWAVIEKSSARLLGHPGLRYPPEIVDTELLYRLDEPWWRQGLATEGGRAAVAFARDRLGSRRTVAFALPENGASIGVMRRPGLRFDGEPSIFGPHAVRYGLILKPDARPGASDAVLV